jgi:hypothetical protein
MEPQEEKQSKIQEMNKDFSLSTQGKGGGGGHN